MITAQDDHLTTTHPRSHLEECKERVSLTERPLAVRVNWQTKISCCKTLHEKRYIQKYMVNDSTHTDIQACLGEAPQSTAQATGVNVALQPLTYIWIWYITLIECNLF